MTGTV